MVIMVDIRQEIVYMNLGYQWVSHRNDLQFKQKPKSNQTQLCLP